MPKSSKKKIVNFGVSLGLLALALIFELAPGSASTTAIGIPPVTNTITTAPSASATPNSTNIANVAQKYTVVKVSDGDTIRVKLGEEKEQTVRLLGVDTPETVDPRKTVQCFGKEASAFVKQQLEGKEVTLELDSTQGDVDKYNRMLRYVYLTDGTFFNLKLLQEGYATEYTYQKPYKFQKGFKAAELAAKEEGKGFWNQTTCNGKR